MKSRLDRYNDNNESKQIGSRLSKNKHLYDDLNNKIGFEELVDFNTQTRIELTSLSEPKRSRESYQQIKDYQQIIGNKEIEKSSKIQEEEIKVFDINSVLEEARKNRNEIDELEKKRKLKSDEYNVLSDLNKKYLSKDKDKEEDKYEGLEELINTITSKTLAQDLKKIEENDDDLFSDLVATSIDLQVKAPHENEKIDITGLIDTSKDDDFEDTEETEVDNSFYTRSMDLSEHDFDFDEETERKSSVKRNILIFVVTVVLLAILIVVGYFVMNHFGFDIKELIG
ncbi:MAG: hypothetical protein IJO43_02850 [Bacilli bacterium]|nr:hypothetical protein [Bacilli bacterium]